MKIVFINQFFWPDSSATSQQLTDLATGLAGRGHEIAVICGDGGYAAAAGGEQPPVEILRVRSLPFTRGLVGRVLSYLSFYVAAFFRALTMRRADVVVSLTTPPLISLLGSMVKILRGSRHFIWEQDIYPDVAISLNYFQAGGIADRVVGLLADFSRRHADGILALGTCMRDRLIDRGVPAEQIYITENWANGEAITPMVRPGDPSRLVVLYSGNFGLAHDLDTLAGAMLRLKDDPRFHFIFVGSGIKRQQLAKFCAAQDIHSLELRPYVDRDKLNEGLAVGDIGLVTQSEDCWGSVVPSKVYGILAAGRPVLFIGPRRATPARTIELHRCGWHVNCGDVEGLTELLLELASDLEAVRAAGVRARQALMEHYDLPLGVARIARILEGKDGKPVLQHLSTVPRDVLLEAPNQER